MAWCRRELDLAGGGRAAATASTFSTPSVVMTPTRPQPTWLPISRAQRSLTVGTAHDATTCLIKQSLRGVDGRPNRGPVRPEMPCRTSRQNPRSLIIHEVGATRLANGSDRRWHGSGPTWLRARGSTNEAGISTLCSSPRWQSDLALRRQNVSHQSWTRSGTSTSSCPKIAGLDSIVAELEASGAEVLRDPFGHVKLNRSTWSMLWRSVCQDAGR